MITLKSAGRLRLKAVPLATAALLIASLTAEGQQRTRPWSCLDENFTPVGRRSLSYR
jgi:hypothetical protein